MTDHQIGEWWFDEGCSSGNEEARLGGAMYWSGTMACGATGSRASSGYGFHGTGVATDGGFVAVVCGCVECGV